MDNAQIWNIVFGGVVSANVGVILIALKVFITMHNRVAALEAVAHNVDRLERIVESLAHSVQNMMIELAEINR